MVSPAADQGYFLAQFMLGNMYYNGSGIPQDYAEAMQWYSLAANQNYAPAQDNLGVMYLQGHGAPQDYVRAYMWLNLAATRGNQEAAHNRDLLAGRMTSEQIAEAQRLEREWKPRPER